MNAKPPRNPWSVGAALLALIGLAAAGCAGPVPSSGEMVRSSAAALSTDDAVARALEWVDAQLQYCQSPNGAADPDPSCSSTCEREENPDWDAYRSDCSGIVSYAWGLPAPGRTTSEFAPEETDITYVIDATQLQPGDAINIPGTHMMLFENWVVPCQTATFIDEAGCSAAITYAHELNADVTLSGSSVTLNSTGETFTAIRYGALTAGSPATGCGVTAPGCVYDTDCNAGQTCDQGTCVASSAAPQCVYDTDCAAGQMCNQGTCVASSAAPQCVYDTDCGAGQMCSQGSCVAVSAPQCSQDSDCGAWQTCNQGSCIASAACQSNADCPSGDYCVIGACIPAWALPTCLSDSDCGAGQACVVGACAPTGCSPACQSDADCSASPAGDTCVRGSCASVSADGGIVGQPSPGVYADGGTPPGAGAQEDAGAGQVYSGGPGVGGGASDAGAFSAQSAPSDSPATPRAGSSGGTATRAFGSTSSGAGGCAVAVAGGSSLPAGGWGALGMLAVGVASRRRRRRA